MGRHHARIYSQLASCRLVGVIDLDLKRAASMAKEFGCTPYASTNALLKDHPSLAAVSVAVPTQDHRQVAQLLLERRIACLIEKPLAPTIAEAAELADLAHHYRALLQVGHTERFNPAVRAVTALGLPVRFLEANRISPITFRSLDVGVVMDLMIHDLDIVLLLAGPRIRSIHATGASVLGEHEDVANARIEFESGCVANLTASRLAPKTQRTLRLFSENAYVRLDYQKRRGVIIRRSNQNIEALERIRTMIAEGSDQNEIDYGSLVQSMVKSEPLLMDEDANRTDPLTGQLTSFLNAVRHDKPPEVDATAGFEAVRVAEQVVTAIKQHQWEGLDNCRIETESRLTTS